MRLLAFGLTLVWSGAVQAFDYVALVIGNDDYRHTSPLSNPGNDAREMKQVLEELGFQVFDPVLDADFTAMQTALLSFAREAAQAEVAVVFYSGHGMELGSKNFLIPVDAKLADESTGRLESVSLDYVREVVGVASRLSMVILDACRTNQFPATTRGPKGMGRLDDRRPGEVVLYSTAAGEVAQDGAGPLSPFTEVLAARLRATPDQDVRILTSSLLLPGHAQTPYSLIGAMPETQVSLAGSWGRLARGPLDLSVWSALTHAPPQMRALTTRAEKDPFFNRMIRAVEIANVYWGRCLAVGISPLDHEDLTVNQVKSLQAFLKAAGGRDPKPSRAAMEEAWETHSVTCFADLDAFLASPLGCNVFSWGLPPLFVPAEESRDAEEIEAAEPFLLDDAADLKALARLAAVEGSGRLEEVDLRICAEILEGRSLKDVWMEDWAQKAFLAFEDFLRHTDMLMEKLLQIPESLEMEAPKQP